MAVTVATTDRTAYSYTNERIDVDEAASYLVNPNQQYILTHSGKNVAGTSSTAVLDVRMNNTDPESIPDYSATSAAQNAWTLFAGGPDCVIGPLGSVKNPNFSILANTGEEAMVLMTALPIPPRY